MRFVFATAASVFLSAQLLATPLDLDGDTDRTGTTDGSPEEEALESSKSVIVINNCDRETASTSHDPDSYDDMVNGSSDLEDMEPIILRKMTSPATSVTLKVRKLSEDAIAEKKCVRLFGKEGKELLGPSKGISYTLSESDLADLRAGDVTFFVEGLQFATSVTLEVINGTTVEDTLRIEVAPFIFTPHTLSARENYVTLIERDPVSQRYVRAFEAACGQANVAMKVIHSNDVWVEDELTWGYTESPRKRFDVAFHMLRQRPLQTAVKALLGPDTGWFQAFDYAAAGLPHTSLTYGGNVEISPPTTSHPFGRVYYGSKLVPDDPQNIYEKRKFPDEFKEFFQRHRLQPPIELHTNWLAVGHIDEIVSFIPKTSGDGAILLISSPKLAFDILRTIPAETSLDSHYQLDFGIATVGDFFRAASLQRTLEEYNLEIDRKIFGLNHSTPSADSIKGILKRELGISESDIIEVPTIFYNTDASTWAGLALTPGVVNLSSMGEISLVPEPFFDPFKTSTQAAIESDGRKVVWIDDWELYHANAGEVHCGSQEKRTGFSRKWWE